MPQGVQVRQVRSLCEAQSVLNNLQDVVATGELRPFVISQVNRKELLASLAQIKHGLFGFDNTLHSASQWAQLRRILGSKAQGFWQADLAERPINGQAVTLSNKIKGRMLCMSPEVQSITEQAILQSGWTTRLIQLMRETGVTREQIHSVADYLPIRPGVADIFQQLTKVSVISWGLSDIIQAWLKSNGLAAGFQNDRVRALEIGATKLSYDKKGRVQDCDLSSLVVNANKGTVAARFLDSYALSEGITLAVGDSIYDAEMLPFISVGPGWHISGVNVLILPPNLALNNLDEFEKYRLERLWQRVTCLLIADDFNPLLSLLSEAKQKYNRSGQRNALIPAQRVKEIFGH